MKKFLDWLLSLLATDDAQMERYVKAQLLIIKS